MENEVGISGFLPIETKTIDDDGEATITGYASTFGNKDLQDDIIENGAFAKSVASLKAAAGSRTDKILPMLFDHDMGRPIGKFVEVDEDRKGLLVKGVLTRGSRLVEDEIIPNLKARVLDKMSIGFFIKEREWKGNVRHIKEAALIETSIVSIPANDQAEIQQMKSGLGKSVMTWDDLEDADFDIRDLERAFREGKALSSKMAKWVAGLVKSGREARQVDHSRDAGSEGQKAAAEYIRQMLNRK